MTTQTPRYTDEQIAEIASQFTTTAAERMLATARASNNAAAIDTWERVLALKGVTV
jgi:hypothetical protein